MSADETSPWTGASGTEYHFFVFGLDSELPPRQGLYIYAKKNDEGAWVPLYVGHGNLAIRCSDSELLGAIRSKGATHVHLRLVSREEDRVDERRDLLSKYENAFAPDGCQPESDRPPALAEPAAPVVPVV